MTIQSDYESTTLFSPFQYPLLSLTKEDKEAMKVSCSCRIYEKACLDSPEIHQQIPRDIDEGVIVHPLEVPAHGIEKWHS